MSEWQFSSFFEGAQVVELVDTLSSGGSAARCAGSSPALSTIFCFLCNADGVGESVFV